MATIANSKFDLAKLRQQYVDPAIQRKAEEAAAAAASATSAASANDPAKPPKTYKVAGGYEWGTPLGTPLPKPQPGQKVVKLAPANRDMGFWEFSAEREQRRNGWLMQSSTDTGSDTGSAEVSTVDAFGELSFVYIRRNGRIIGSEEVPDARQHDRRLPRPRQDTQPLFGIDHSDGWTFMLEDADGEFISLYRQAVKARKAIDDITDARDVDCTHNDRFWNPETGLWELTPDEPDWWDGRLDSFQLLNQCQGRHLPGDPGRAESRPYTLMQPAPWQPREVRQARNRLYLRGGLPQPSRRPHTD